MYALVNLPYSIIKKVLTQVRQPWKMPFSEHYWVIMFLINHLVNL